MAFWEFRKAAPDGGSYAVVEFADGGVNSIAIGNVTLTKNDIKRILLEVIR